METTEKVIDKGINVLTTGERTLEKAEDFIIHLDALISKCQIFSEKLNEGYSNIKKSVKKAYKAKIDKYEREFNEHKKEFTLKKNSEDAYINFLQTCVKYEKKIKKLNKRYENVDEDMKKLMIGIGITAGGMTLAAALAKIVSSSIKK